MARNFTNETDQTPPGSPSPLDLAAGDDTGGADDDAEQDSSSKKIDAATAVYMELAGAQKDGQCDVVDVPGGVSKDRGCCDLFKDGGGADEFKCGECAFLSGGPSEEAEAQPESPSAAPQTPRAPAASAATPFSPLTR